MECSVQYVYTFGDSCVQIIKIKESGETWVERSPFNPEGYFLDFAKKEKEGEEEEGVISAESLSSISDVSQEDEPVKPVEPVELDASLSERNTSSAERDTSLSERDTSSASGSDISVGREELADSKRAEGSETTPPEEEKSVEVSAATRKVKLARRRVVLNVPADKEEREGEEGGGVLLRSKQPVRSKTVSCGAPSSAGANALRRQSLVMLHQGKTGQKGSRRFRAALRRDSVYEGHPGWESIRKLSVVVG